MSNDEHVLWKRAAWECVMVSCCAGAELQLRKIRPQADNTDDADPPRRQLQPSSRRASREQDFEVVIRELYPTKSDLYERSRHLQIEYGAAAPSTIGD